MPILRIYVSDQCLDRLTNHAAKDSMSRTVEQLAEAAVEEAALQAELAQGGSVENTRPV